MSTFTEWNGPQTARGASTKDVVALIDAYNNMNAFLAKHTASTATDDVHGFNTALQEAIATLENSINAALNAKASADSLNELSGTVADNAAAIASEASRAQGTEESLASAIAVENRRALAAELATNEAVAALEEALNEFKETYLANSSQIAYDGDVTTTITGIVAATEHFIGTIKARYFTDLVEWRTFNAQYAGTGINDATTATYGVYILGRMSDEWLPDMGFEDTAAPKTARAHVKYINDRPFDLIVDMAVTSAKEGSITCLASFEKPWTLDDPADAWENMTLHLLTNTDSSGKTHVFLGLSAKGLSGQSTIFHVAGENFIPGGNVNGISNRIGFTRVKHGFNGSRANLDDLRVEALNDAYGKVILKVEYNNDIVGWKHKDLYIADPSYEGVYFLRRPSVIYTPGEEADGEDIASEIAPVLTSLDLDAVSSGGSLKGIIVFWPQWEEVSVDNPNSPGTEILIRRAINVPEGWLACDGSEVSSEDYPGLAEKLGQSGDTLTLPLMDYAIIRVLDLFENIDLKEEATSIRILTHKELTEAIINVQQNVETETAERIEADEQLQANIDAEAAARIEADENLQANLNTETEQRLEADRNLQDNINAETEAREEADINLQNNLNAETEARIAADTALQEALDAETAAREEADINLQNNLNAETAAREEADTNLQNNLNAETEARVASDLALQEALDAEEAARIAADTALQEALDTEEATREAADEQLTADLTAEIAARLAGDSALQANIESEAATRQAADTTLQSNIDTEASTRAAADAALSTSISEVASNVGTIASNVATIGSNLAEEVQTRMDADTALQANIDAEAAAREEADQTLQDNIDAEAATRQANDETLQANIDAEAATRQTNDEALQAQIDELDESKAESWTGTQDEFDDAKSGLSDGTIILSEDELEDD